MEIYKIETEAIRFFLNSLTSKKTDPQASNYPKFFYQHTDEYTYFSSYTLNFFVKNKTAEFNLNEKCQKLEVPKEKQKELESKLHFTVDAYLQDPPNQLTLAEIYLWIYLHPQFSIEYIGRNVPNVNSYDPNDTPKLDQIFMVDVIDGKRKYFWKIKNAAYEANNRDAHIRYSHVKAWFKEDNQDTRIVLSLGSGGLRMYGITALLKIFDMLDVRSNFDEIWGCSGGAIIGYTYSKGISPQWVENMAYDFYNKRYPDFALKGLKPSVLYHIVKAKIKSKAKLADGFVEIQKTFTEALEKVTQKKHPYLSEIPFYALATSQKGHGIVFSAPQHISPACENMIYPCDPIQGAIASASIPFLIHPTIVEVMNQSQHVCVDGFLAEEVPLFSPFQKWQRDRKLDPENTPSKLKIFYVDLRLRFSELDFVKKFEKYLHPESKILLGGRLVDLLMDTRIEQNAQLLKSMPNVQVIGVPLILGKFAALDSNLLPFIIQKGRSHFLHVLDELDVLLSKCSPIKNPNDAHELLKRTDEINQITEKIADIMYKERQFRKSA